MDLREQFASFPVRPRTANAFQSQSHFHVLLRCKGGEEIEGLEDETDVAQPHTWQVALFQVRNLEARDLDTARTTPQNASMMESSVVLPLPDGPIRSSTSPL